MAKRKDVRVTIILECTSCIRNSVKSRGNKNVLFWGISRFSLRFIFRRPILLNSHFC